jgi:hypothetical protein
MKIKMWLFGMFLFSVVFSTIGQNKKDHLGLVYELATIKYSSEANIAILLSYDKDSDNIQSVLTVYSHLSTIINPLILQLQADIASQNSVSEYKKLDNLLKENTVDKCHSRNNTIQNYIEALQAASLTRDSLVNTINSILSPTPSDTLETATLETALPLISSAIGIVSTGVSIANTINSMETAKVNAVSAILEKLKLSSVSDLLSGGKPTTTPTTGKVTQ